MTQTTAAEMAHATASGTKKTSQFRRFLPLTLMTLPGLAYLAINNCLPMFGIVIAFKNVNFSKGILGSDWVVFKNFEYLFKTSDAYIITRNTIAYNLAWIVIGTVLAIVFAIMLNEIRNKFFTRLIPVIFLQAS